nr:GIY-YIG nuclease family protein [uncultured Pseudomonas sp.]
MPDSSIPVATPSPTKAWFVYLVRAANGALYCGISDDPHKRFAKHQSGKGARFFHSSPARALVHIETCASKGDALRRERAIKALSKAAKETLVAASAVIAVVDNAPSG